MQKKKRQRVGKDVVIRGPRRRIFFNGGKTK
jgi:hypothetical protein